MGTQTQSFRISDDYTRLRQPCPQLSLCRTATEACRPRASAPQQEKPPQWEAPCSLQLEKASVHQWRPSATKKRQWWVQAVFSPGEWGMWKFLLLCLLLHTGTRMGKPGGKVGPRPEILEEEGVGDKDTPHLPRQKVHVPRRMRTSLVHEPWLKVTR